MRVHHDGLTFSASRITGPTHQFVRLCFAEEVAGSAPLIHDPREGHAPGPELTALAEEMLSRFADMLPLHGRWHVAEVQLAEGDHPQSVGCWALFRDIMAEAEAALPAQGPAPEGARTWRPPKKAPARTDAA